MLRSVKKLYGYPIHAEDGNIGRVHEFYFDDRSWTIRYLVVNTGNWLLGRRVLISPSALGQPDWEAGIFPVDLSKEQVESSPDTDTDEPISRQQKIGLHECCGWLICWNGGAQVLAMTVVDQEAKKDAPPKGGNPYLRSTREVIGYHIQATGGEVGHVDDFIVDDEIWIIRYMVVDTRNWLLGKEVLVSPQWIEMISYEESNVRVGLSQESIKSSPEFDPSAHVDREYEEQFYDYYGRLRYWD